MYHACTHEETKRGGWSQAGHRTVGRTSGRSASRRRRVDAALRLVRTLPSFITRCHHTPPCLSLAASHAIPHLSGLRHSPIGVARAVSPSARRAPSMARPPPVLPRCCGHSAAHINAASIRPSKIGHGAWLDISRTRRHESESGALRSRVHDGARACGWQPERNGSSAVASRVRQHRRDTRRVHQISCVGERASRCSGAPKTCTSSRARKPRQSRSCDHV